MEDYFKLSLLDVSKNDFDLLLWVHPSFQELENFTHSVVILETC